MNDYTIVYRASHRENSNKTGDMSAESVLGKCIRSGEVVIVNDRKMPQICGPKLSNCCFILSIWGVIMLVLMGVFFRIESVALLEDIPKGGSEKDGYHEASTNCFIAAGLYVAMFIFTSYQKYAISRGHARC